MDTLTTPTAPAIALPFTADMVAAFKALVPFVSKDAVSPSIGYVEVSHRYLIATDRYSIGRYEHTTYAESVERHGEEGPASPDAVVYIPREVAEWIGKQKATGSQVITFTPETVSITWESGDSLVAIQAFVAYSHNFPPVARLITEESAESVDILPFAIGTDRLSQLVKAGTALTKSVGKNAGWRFQIVSPEHSHKLAPIRATLGPRMLAMIQPTLPSR